MAGDIDNLAEVRRKLLGWHRRDGLQAPWRESADPYEVMVAAMMAQQTQMSRVLASYERFLDAFPTLESLASASTGAVIRVWKGMGYNTRAVRLHRAAQSVAASGWPRTAAELATIPGIGPFTAAIVASFAFGEPAACVDTNVRRVLGRLAGEEHASATGMQRLADASMAAEEPARWNQALMDYGARICVIRPKCGECVVAEHCRWLCENGEPSRVAEPRAGYDAGSPRRRANGLESKRDSTPATPYELSTRWYRGRIVDALRELPVGKSLPIADLGMRIGNGSAPLAETEARALVEALARDGLVVVRGNGDEPSEVALPD